MTVLSSLTAFLLLAVSLPVAVHAAIGPETKLHIVNAEVNPDGVPRQGVLAEGVFPGPLIRGKKGDTFKINVIDQLTNATMKKSTSIADGAASVTQCPIATGDSFLYKFREPTRAGTFWYHSHLSTQYCDGLRGPLVVYDPHDPFAHLYDVDNENTIITLADWYHTAAPLIPPPAQADATLINGLGRYTNGPPSPLAVITVQKGKRYRMRLINISCDPNYIFSIDGHNMTIIEADGENHLPLQVDSIRIFAGQRYSFILNANQPVGNYWIRAAAPGQPKLVGFGGGINSAILRYVGAPNEEPTTNETESVNPLNEVNLHPLDDPFAPGKPWAGGADKVIPLALTFNKGLFYVNNATFQPPTVPVLLQILSGARTPQELLPHGSVIPLPRNSVIELVIPPGSAPGGPHPFHLHGHSFSVVRSAGSKTYNYVNPVRRDTVSIGTDPNDAVTIRFKTDNPGPWFLHCHIDFHLEAGLAIVFAEDIGDTKFANPVPQAWSELCPKYNSLDPGDL